MMFGSNSAGISGLIRSWTERSKVRIHACARVQYEVLFIQGSDGSDCVEGSEMIRSQYQVRIPRLLEATWLLVVGGSGIEQLAAVSINCQSLVVGGNCLEAS
ncbi:hypothetical protein Tco_1535263 [Tanacetum coccineum]